jgi:hypothetical protein
MLTSGVSSDVTVFSGVYPSSTDMTKSWMVGELSAEVFEFEFEVDGVLKCITLSK